MPFVILTGPFLPDLFVSIMALIFIYFSIKYKLTRYYYNKFFILFALFYVYLIINSLISEFTYFSLQSSFFYFGFGIFTLSVWFLLENLDGLLRKLTIIFFITFLIALADGYTQYFLGHNIFGHVYDWSRGTVRLRLYLVIK